MKFWNRAFFLLCIFEISQKRLKPFIIRPISSFCKKKTWNMKKCYGRGNLGSVPRDLKSLSIWSSCSPRFTFTIFFSYSLVLHAISLTTNIFLFSRYQIMTTTFLWSTHQFALPRGSVKLRTIFLRFSQVIVYRYCVLLVFIQYFLLSWASCLVHPLRIFFFFFLDSLKRRYWDLLVSFLNNGYTTH